MMIIASILAGTGYKYGPVAWHKVDAQYFHSKSTATASAKSNSTATVQSTVTTNAAGIKISNCDLGAISLTNHCETCVSLGGGKNCVLTPKLVDAHDVQLTVTVESKNPNGKIHDLSVAQVVTHTGQPFEVAVGDFSLSLTANVISE